MSKGPKPKDPTIKFLEKVDTTQGYGPWGNCHMWTGALNKGGYGQFWTSSGTIAAHRFAFFIKYGHYPINNGCHSCDIAACVNVEHILDQTQEENIRHALQVGRWKTKLTVEQLRWIRDNRHLITQTEMAKQLKISSSTVSRILSNQARQYTL